ncbi:sigma factor-like helix-turn-helix DNA-binding protein [Carnobacterium pleistocenium]|uniref:sigma factor-like helix-turn-helix DNA-binding protein n=1 Tax=Carnobacterium pleistocenium TaxID=181073 RepID=UPI00068FC392|nr:sigma factor-like helix-turn-helix DNA-binding protein [Carnobacterium pleistocenium]
MWHYADELSDEYKKGLRELRLERMKRKSFKDELKLSNRIDEWTNDMEVELRTISGMISDMEYAISWLENAREPGLKRGITNKSRYQRTELWAEIDILSMKAYRMQSTVEGRELTLEEDTRMNEILDCLSKREREAYRYIMGEGHTYAETAYFMEITRGAVQMLVNRAKSKIQDCLETGKVQTTLVFA